MAWKTGRIAYLFPQAAHWFDGSIVNPRNLVEILSMDKPVKTYQQSGVLPFYEDRVVLITARSTGRWIIPKGHVEKGMTPADSAAKEAFEEAGVTGKVVGGEIGVYRYQRPNGLYTVSVFPFEVEQLLDVWHEMAFRQRRLVTPEEAINMIVQEQLRAVVESYFAGMARC